MKYSKPETLAHIVSVNNPGCLTVFNDLIVKEGYDGVGNVFNDDIIVLDMDCVEINNARNEGNRNRNSSMDCTFAIKDEVNNNVEMLLVELRFNYQKLKKLKQEKLLDKVSGSTLALGTSVPICTTYVFIFKTNLKEQARSWFFRRFPAIPRNYVVMDILDLKAIYF